MLLCFFQGHTPLAASIFLSMYFLNVLSENLLRNLPSGVRIWQDVSISTDRIQVMACIVN